MRVVPALVSNLARSESGRQVRGVLEAISGLIVEGWAVDQSAPDQPVTIEIFMDDQLLGATVALMFGPDLAQSGLGDRNHYFKFLLPAEVLDGSTRLISTRVRGTGHHLKNSPMRLPSQLPRAVEPLRSEGWLDYVSEDGWVLGWAWFPEAPDRRPEIEILIDGVVCGTALAASHRADLSAAGIGDGYYGFSFALPFDVVAQAREALISARERNSGQVLTSPRPFRRRAVADAIAMITALEDDVRLLRASLEQVKRRETADNQAAAELFRTVGDFFVQLAEAAQSGRPAGSLRTLRGAIDDVTSHFEPLEFEYPSEPLVSVCIEARGPSAGIYRTLRALRDRVNGQESEIILFDDGSSYDAPLLPLVARNLRYLYVANAEAQVAHRNQVAEYARGHVLVFLAPNAEPMAGWLESVLSAFDTAESVAMLGAKIMRADGVLEHAGISLKEGRRVILGSGEDPSAEAFAKARLIDSVAPEAFAVRADAWRRMGGVDEILGDLAIDDFCARIIADGGSILYDPNFTILLRQS